MRQGDAIDGTLNDHSLPYLGRRCQPHTSGRVIRKSCCDRLATIASSRWKKNGGHSADRALGSTAPLLCLR